MIRFESQIVFFHQTIFKFTTDYENKTFDEIIKKTNPNYILQQINYIYIN